MFTSGHFGVPEDGGVGGEGVYGNGQAPDEWQQAVACEQQEPSALGAEPAVEEDMGPVEGLLCADAHQYASAADDWKDRL
jgi:hypothetical protein